MFGSDLMGLIRDPSYSLSYICVFVRSLNFQKVTYSLSFEPYALWIQTQTFHTYPLYDTPRPFLVLDKKPSITPKNSTRSQPSLSPNHLAGESHHDVLSSPLSAPIKIKWMGLIFWNIGSNLSSSPCLDLKLSNLLILKVICPPWCLLDVYLEKIKLERDEFCDKMEG